MVMVVFCVALINGLMFLLGLLAIRKALHALDKIFVKEKVVPRTTQVEELISGFEDKILSNHQDELLTFAFEWSKQELLQNLLAHDLPQPQVYIKPKTNLVSVFKPLSTEKLIRMIGCLPPAVRVAYILSICRNVGISWPLERALTGRFCFWEPLAV